MSGSTANNKFNNLKSDEKPPRVANYHTIPDALKSGYYTPEELNRLPYKQKRDLFTHGLSDMMHMPSTKAGRHVVVQPHDAHDREEHVDAPPQLDTLQLEPITF